MGKYQDPDLAVRSFLYIYSWSRHNCIVIPERSSMHWWSFPAEIAPSLKLLSIGLVQKSEVPGTPSSRHYDILQAFAGPRFRMRHDDPRLIDTWITRIQATKRKNAMFLLRQWISRCQSIFWVSWNMKITWIVLWCFTLFYIYLYIHVHAYSYLLHMDTYIDTCLIFIHLYSKICYWM